MNKKNTPSYRSDSVKISIFFLLAFILYAVGVVVFISKGDDKTVGAFEAVTGVSGLILSFATIFYVAKAYGQQKRQNDIQSLQIETQKKQIEENKKDVEFNRALDIVYRQLEHSKDKLVATEADFMKYSSSMKNTEDLLQKYSGILQYFILLNYENQFFIKLLENVNLDGETKKFLFRIHTSNLSYFYKLIIQNTIRIVNNSENIINSFKETTYKKYESRVIDSMKAPGFSHATKEEQQDIIEKQYKQEIDNEFKNFELLLRHVDNIDNTFKKYDVWLKVTE